MTQFYGVTDDEAGSMLDYLIKLIVDGQLSIDPRDKEEDKENWGKAINAIIYGFEKKREALQS
ncbi:hypothetical protein [Niallia taxi]|uniref:hypothetical protein n=1 Tax=Niallia taxi TaxID=2499688 RepID=UPI003D29D649